MDRYAGKTIYEVLDSRALLNPNKIALIDDKKKITFKKLKQYVDSVAAYLKEYGIKSGDRIAIFMPNRWEYVVAIFAISKVGATIVPIDTFLKSQELSFILKDANVKLIFADYDLIKIINGSIAVVNCNQLILVNGGDKGTKFEDILTLEQSYESQDRDIDDIAAIFYTSGTTGKPKGAMLSTRNILASTQFLKSRLKLTPKDRVMLFIPIFHSYAFNIGLITPIANSISIVIVKSLRPFSNIFKQTIEKRVTIFLGVPEVYNAISLTKLPWSFKIFNSVRVAVSGGSSLSEKTHLRLQKKFNKAKIIEGYGLTESAAAISTNTLDNQKIGSVGLVSPICVLKIVDKNGVKLGNNEIGEIVVKGENIIKSYLNCDCDNIKDGWLYTGDLGYLDSEGYLFIVDRKSDVIISKGFNIYPKEVEKVLNRYEGVKKSAVIGADDKINGEIAVAFLEVDDMQVDIQKLNNYVKGFLASYKVPKKYIVIDSIPTTATGKIKKYKLKELLKEEKR